MIHQMIPLNIFQRVVRQWEHVHPYNAAQMLRISGRADMPTLQKAWEDCLHTLALGPVQAAATRYWFDASVLHSVRPKLAAPIVPLCHFISEELNRPFEANEIPFRPFVLDEGGTYVVGVVYQHWVADSVSIRLLLREWFTRFYSPSASRRLPLNFPKGGYWRYLGPQHGKWNFLDGLMRIPRSFSRLRRVRKIQSRRSADYCMHFIWRRAEAGLIDRLHAWARARGVTVNDVFLAAMAQACWRLLPLQSVRRRPDLALGMIMDLRSGMQSREADVFGLFLGFSNVVCRPSDFGDFQRLLDSIAAQSRHHKRVGTAYASMIWLFDAVMFGRLMEPAKTYHFYRKHMPLAGGISNVNFSGGWAAQWHPDPIREYIRVSPTGPMIPLAFTPTTLGREFNLGLTYRAAIIGDDLAGRIADFFLSRLEEAARTPP